MWLSAQNWLHLVKMLLLLLSIQFSEGLARTENGMKSSVFLSPEFVLAPGSVVNKYYHNIDFPRGHIALKSFDAEVIDESGEPVPLHETYLHHWVVMRYYQCKNVEAPEYNKNRELHQSDSDLIIARNTGICPNIGQYFGLGSETRRTNTHVPDPYGIEIGNPEEIPVGYEERWLLNVHAIDTRGADDRLGCTECRCDLYNVTVDEYGRTLSPDYDGGLRCCYDQTQCSVKSDFEGARRSLYLRYTIKWVDWDDSIFPVKIFIFDVTDTQRNSSDSTGLGPTHDCKVEYEVESCSATGVVNDKCIDIKRTSVTMPIGGYVIYGVAHQHSGGVGSTLYGEDGRVICSSVPTYGEGEETGNEAGYIVGMSTCYPEPGSIKIYGGESLMLESNYSSARRHTGVMGLFYILVADSVPNHIHASLQVQAAPNYYVWPLALLGVGIAVAVAAAYRLRNGREEGYDLIVM